jgi:hypothetical protein
LASSWRTRRSRRFSPATACGDDTK